MSNYNVAKLDAELKAACPRVVGVSTANGGRVDFADGTSWVVGTTCGSDDHRACDAAVKAHEPGQTRAQKLRTVGMSESEAALAIVLHKGALAPAWARAVVKALADAAEAATA